ncbi:MAG: hypothetical protein HOW73_16150 [Polyangiaceae bacterium]|nr:hypothetical protein [Polyangiaceae bacterium]
MQQVAKRYVLPLLLAAASVGVSVGLSGCGTPGGFVRLSVRQYEVGNYNAASRACWDASEDEDYLNDKAHVRYLVYCGLTHYRLGRREQARAMLHEGNVEYLQGRSNWLKPAVVDDLYKALDDLEGRTIARPTRESFSAR